MKDLYKSSSKIYYAYLKNRSVDVRTGGSAPLCAVIDLGVWFTAVQQVRSAHVGGERRRRSQIYCSAVAGPVGAAVLATVVFFDTTCSRVSCNRC